MRPPATEVPWRVTIRSGPRVIRSRFGTLQAALDELGSTAQRLAREASHRPVDVKVRRFDPAQQVAARLELAGPERVLPSVRGGVDVRGDGSMEAYWGRVRRRLVEQRKDEEAADALAREVRARTT